MKIIVVIAGFLLTICACQEITPGYLITEYADYTMDSMVVKKVLDLTPPESNPEYEMYLGWGYTPEELIMEGIYPTIGGDEYKRDKYGWPWTSTPIEGIEGTKPIHVSIKSITTDVGNVDKMWKNLIVRGDGSFLLPVYCDVETGRYTISLIFENEGYSKEIDNIFTIIVK